MKTKFTAILHSIVKSYKRDVFTELDRVRACEQKQTNILYIHIFQLKRDQASFHLKDGVRRKGHLRQPNDF
jgi:hypothetical protein